MVKRTVNAPDTEPDQKSFPVPSEGEHLFQIVDVYDYTSEMGAKLSLDPDTVSAKAEVVGGSEEGRSLLIRASLDENWKGFFFTRLLLKAIGLPHKGKIDIDTDEWVGRQFFGEVVHDGKYANIDKFNFDKMIDNSNAPSAEDKDRQAKIDSNEIAWDE